MAASNSSFVAGHYTGTFNAQALGRTEAGFSIEPIYHNEPIRTDDFGDVMIDGIYRGYDLRVSFTLQEWTAAARQSLQFPFDTTLGTIAGVGQTLRDFAKQLVLTPVAGINAASKAYTFPLASPDQNHGAFILNTRLRVVRCNLIILPNIDTGVLFTQSA